MMFVPPEYTCYCEWDHYIRTYGDYLRVREERKRFLNHCGKAEHVYRDSYGRIVIVDRTFDWRVRQGLVKYPLWGIRPKT